MKSSAFIARLAAFFELRFEQQPNRNSPLSSWSRETLAERSAAFVGVRSKRKKSEAAPLTSARIVSNRSTPTRDSDEQSHRGTVHRTSLPSLPLPTRGPWLSRAGA